MANHYLDRSIPEPTIEDKLDGLRDEDNALSDVQLQLDHEMSAIKLVLDKMEELKNFSKKYDGMYFETGTYDSPTEENYIKSLLFCHRQAELKMRRIANRRKDIQKEFYILNDQKTVNEVWKNYKEDNTNGSTADN